ncbi:MAG: hypothetical protein HY313_09615 [Acidobacteria bacterium]|nr:hypothetical protein [Acidobacteriota bacterium]
MTVRRMKTYSGENGYVYQYYFLESKPQRRLWAPSGIAFLFQVTGDRKNFFVAEVLLEETAWKTWEKMHGRPLVEQEKYAAAKMALFRAFDESSRPEDLLHIRVKASNIEDLLAPLRLDE